MYGDPVIMAMFRDWITKNGYSDLSDIGQQSKFTEFINSKFGADASGLSGVTPTPEPGDDPSGSGSGKKGSWLDEIVKSSRDFGNAGQELTTGWDDSLKAILEMVDGVSWATNGLANDLRSVNVPESMIEKFLGMDPEEWEQAKKELFDVNGELNDKGKKVVSAYVSSVIANKRGENEKDTSATNKQIDAYEKLKKMGYSTAEAFELTKDKKVADAIATSDNNEEVKKLVESQRELNKAQEEYQEISEQQRISEAVRDANKEFAEQLKAVKKLTREQKKYSDAQISAILSNKDLMKLYLKPGIDKKALEKALDNANKEAKLELMIKRLTFSGQQDLFSQGMSDVSSAFTALENEISLNFRMKITPDEDLVQTAEREIANIQYELDGYNAALEEIGMQEDKINRVYDKRFEALDRVREVNDQIAASQERQLDLADALSKGDISAAAKAAQQMQARGQEDALSAQRTMLERSQRAEIESLRSSSGLTKSELEVLIANLEESIFNIEQQTIRPAEERMRLAEIERDDRIAALVVLGKTRDEWDRIQNRVDLAAAAGWRFVDSITEALNIFEKLISNLTFRGKNKSSGGMVRGYRMGGLIPYKASGGLFSSLGSDTVPAMLTPGEFVVRRPAVSSFGADNLKKINNGTYDGNSVYNYNLAVNVKSDANPEQIASTVMRSIKQVEGRRIRGNGYNG